MYCSSNFGLSLELSELCFIHGKLQKQTFLFSWVLNVLRFRIFALFFVSYSYFWCFSFFNAFFYLSFIWALWICNLLRIRMYSFDTLSFHEKSTCKSKQNRVIALGKSTLTWVRWHMNWKKNPPQIYFSNGHFQAQISRNQMGLQTTGELK